MEGTSAASSEKPFASRDWWIEATQSSAVGMGSNAVCPTPELSGHDETLTLGEYGPSIIYGHYSNLTDA